MSAQRLSLWQAALVVARRDFVAILFSRAFIFFLLGPLFPIVVGVLAGGIGQKVQQTAGQGEIGVAMAPADTDAMIAAYGQLAPKLGPALPKMVELKRLQPGESFDAKAALSQRRGLIAAVVTGTPAHPTLTATAQRAEMWKGTVGLIAANALLQPRPTDPEVRTAIVATSGASERIGRVRTAQAGLMLLFLLTMLLAGMVLSNLVEEKANKIIEVLAAAIPMDALFLGKLFAMLAVSMVGLSVWGSVVGLLALLGGPHGPIVVAMQNLPIPGVGWPLFFLLGIVYFTMNYLILGSIFLALGSMAATVREVQTLSMPATMAQLLVFFFSNYALADTGGPVELIAIAFPLTSPYAMFSRAAMEQSLWPHLPVLIWQALWVILFIRAGSSLFRRRVMKSGPRAVKKRRGPLAILKGGSNSVAAPE